MHKHVPVVALLLAAASGLASAQNEVYVCVDENGRKEYKNTGSTKGCTPVELPGLVTIPAPSRKPTDPAAAARPSPASSATAGSASPASFPKVDSTTQRARDNDRRQILLEEMRQEEQKLANLKKEYNNGEAERRGDERNYAKYQERVANLRDDISRTERNIDALRRELGNLK